MSDRGGPAMADHQHVGMPASQGACVLHKTHRPKPLRLVTHHVQPTKMGGADVAANKVVCCDNGHYAVHTILAWLIFDDADPAKDPGGTRTERATARKGYDAWVAAGKPGDPRAAYALAWHH